MDKYKFQGYYSLIKTYHDELLLRRNVAMFPDYESAKNDILTMLANSNDEFTMDAIRFAIKNLEELCDMDEFYNPNI